MDNKYKVIIAMVMVLLAVSFATAAVEGSYDYISAYYTDVNISEVCEAESFPCDAAFGCNITVTNPLEEVVVRDAPMTRNFPDYVYTFTNTSILGDYKVKVYCTNGTYKGLNDDIILHVTTDGKPESIKMQLFLLIVSLIAFLLALYLKSHPIGFISGVLFVITGIYMMAYGFGDIANLYTQSMAYVVLAFGLFIILIAGYEWLDEVG